MANPNSPITILVVEDDVDVNEIIVNTLRDEGFEVQTAFDGEQGLKRARELRPSLIMLDVNMPALNGMEVCRRLKEESSTQNIPVIILTANADENDVVLGLGVGANDYVAKPFRPNELIARIRAQLRQLSKQNPAQRTISAGPIEMNLGRHEVTCQGHPVELTGKEFRLLWALGTKAGEVLSRDQLLKEISEPGESLQGRNVDVHINTIRKKLGRGTQLIVSVRGLGYKLVA